MADKPVCKYPDCDNLKATRFRRGYCYRHYEKFLRWGDPAGVKNEDGKALKFFNEVVLTYAGDDCLIWPFHRMKKKGYCQFHYGGSMRLVHRVAYEVISGEPIPKGLEVAHSCGKGHLGCVSPKHLSLKTRLQNIHDKFAHGTMTMGEKVWKATLTEDDVREIRALRQSSGMQYQKIAEKYGVTDSCIRAICHRKNWKHVA